MKKLLILLLTIGLIQVTDGQSKFLVVSKSANLYTSNSSSSSIIEKLDGNVVLEVLGDGKQTSNGWYNVLAPSGRVGFVYRTRVRGRSSESVPSISASRSIGVSNERLRKDLWPEINNSSDQIIIHEGFITCMDKNLNVPKWVFHHINKDLLDEGVGDKRSRPGKYFRDPAYSNLKQDALAGSGYDHGHLAPAGDFKRDSTLFAESFFMTNMSPQHGCMNQKGWCLLESNVREWARDRPDSDFYIVSGAMTNAFIDTLCLPRDIQIFVPAQFYKIVLEISNNMLVGSTAYVIQNGNVDGMDVDEFDTVIDRVEEICGINFFPNLTPGQETLFEAKSTTYEIKDLHECISRNQDCDVIYSRRPKPEERSKLNCTSDE